MPEPLDGEIRQLYEEWIANPSSVVCARLADRLRVVNRNDEAMEVAQRGLVEWPSNTSIRVVAARCLRDSGDIPSAIEAFRKVLEVDPLNLIALRSLAEMSYSRGEFHEAVRLFGDYLFENPGDQEAEQLLEEAKKHQKESAASPRSGPVLAPAPPAAEAHEPSAGTAAAEEDRTPGQDREPEVETPPPAPSEEAIPPQEEPVLPWAGPEASTPVPAETPPGVTDPGEPAAAPAEASGEPPAEPVPPEPLPAVAESSAPPVTGPADSGALPAEAGSPLPEAGESSAPEPAATEAPSPEPPAEPVAEEPKTSDQPFSWPWEQAPGAGVAPTTPTPPEMAEEAHETAASGDTGRHEGDEPYPARYPQTARMDRILKDQGVGTDGPPAPAAAAPAAAHAAAAPAAAHAAAAPEAAPEVQRPVEPVRPAPLRREPRSLFDLFAPEERAELFLEPYRQEEK